MIGIIDYGMGNLRSVNKAFEYLDFDSFIINDRADFKRADKLVLPGVGAFYDAISTLKAKEYDKEIIEFINNGKLFLGICLGMQLLFGTSYENGRHKGLGILEGNIVELPSGLKIPHVGWNSLDVIKESPLFSGLPENKYVYFVHSYHLETSAPIISATTNYGKDIQIAVQEKNIFGVQFHPEKSGENGLKILTNFGGL